METQAIRATFAVTVQAKEEGDPQKSGLTLSCLIPKLSAQFPVKITRVPPEQYAAFEVGKAYNVVLERGGIKRDADGNPKSGQYAGDFFWNWPALPIGKGITPQGGTPVAQGGTPVSKGVPLPPVPTPKPTAQAKPAPSPLPVPLPPADTPAAIEQRKRVSIERQASLEQAVLFYGHRMPIAVDAVLMDGDVVVKIAEQFYRFISGQAEAVEEQPPPEPTDPDDLPF